MKLRRKKRMPAAARRKQRAQRLKLLGQFVREHSWGVMITVLIVIGMESFAASELRAVGFFRKEKTDGRA